MKLTSVSGVKSLRLGNCCRILSETCPRATRMTYAFHPIVRCLPSAQLSYDDRRTRCKRMEYARIVHSKEDIVDAQRESRKDKDAGGHDALYEHVSDGQVRSMGY